MSRIIATDVFLSTKDHGTIHLAKGTAEADVPQWLKDEKSLMYVPPVAGHFADSSAPLLGDHLWVNA